MVISSSGYGADSGNFQSTRFRQEPLENLIPGTHRLEIDLEDGVSPRYAAQALASQEASQGVFRHLDPEDKASAEAIFDEKPTSEADRWARQVRLHEFRNENMKKAASKVE